MNLNYLRIFYEVAKNKSFSRAADKLCITQPAVSIQIKRLEQCLGVRLIEKAGRELRLTEIPVEKVPPEKKIEPTKIKEFKPPEEVKPKEEVKMEELVEAVVAEKAKELAKKFTIYEKKNSEFEEKFESINSELKKIKEMEKAKEELIIKNIKELSATIENLSARTKALETAVKQILPKLIKKKLKKE